MEAYQYKYGDRPLEGYTIQRAAGRGGFGEVYYAISDSGRQVALKVVQSHEQIELRGISQCMNLKSPHLVTVFDVKHNDQGRPFVIMEYVSGPSLSDLLKETPGGLGTQKAAFFLREIAKGLSYLHECGIVHRDLKPSNIFYENGYVKIGDYGLTKAISASRHVSHTITVGTVHYMAPEIGAGRYDRSVDIYALGVLFYEMLTGQVPFLGASPAEILMKHMSATADLSHIEEPFARVIRRALAKDPAERYQTVQEMVEDIFGTEHVRNSVSQFSPEELSVVAQHVAQKIGRAQPKPGAYPPGGAQTKDKSDFSKQVGKKAERIAQKAEEFAKKAEVFSGQMADKLKTAKERAQETGQKVVVADPLIARQRRTLAVIAAAVMALGAGMLNQQAFFPVAIVVFVMIGVASEILLYSRRRWWVTLDEDSRWLGKAASCFGAAFLAILVAGFVNAAFNLGVFRGGGRFWPFFPLRHLPFIGNIFGGQGASVLALALPMLLVDWLKITDSQRPKRIELGHAIWVGFLGIVAGNMFGLPAVVTACVLAGTVLVVQAKSSIGRPISGAVAANARAQRRAADGGPVIRPVRAQTRTLWLVGSLVSFGLGLFLCILAGTGPHGEEFAFTVAFGVDSFFVAAFCFIMMCRATFAGWYRYLLRPVILLTCVITTVTASILLGNLNLGGEEGAIALFFIIFPNILFLVFLLTPARVFGSPDSAEIKRQSSRYTAPPSGPVSPRKRLTALLLALIPFVLPFVPAAGMQRFYVGKVGTGILWLFTWGFFGIGQLIDIIMVATGQFRDNYGLPLLLWSDRTAAAMGSRPQTPPSPAPVTPAEVPDQPAGPVHQAVEEPAPAPAVQPSSTPSCASSGTIVYEPWHPFSGLLAGLGHLLVFVAFLVGMALAVQLPLMVSLGFPDPSLAQEIEQAFGPNWVGGMEKVALAAATVVFLLGAVLIIIGRRVHGVLHILRALVGLGGIGTTTMFMVDEMVSSYRFRNEPPQAFMEVLQQLRVETLAIGGIFLVISIAILAWPPRRRQPVLAPMPVPNQGVSV